MISLQDLANDISDKIRETYPATQVKYPGELSAEFGTEMLDADEELGIRIHDSVFYENEVEYNRQITILHTALGILTWAPLSSKRSESSIQDRRS